MGQEYSKRHKFVNSLPRAFSEPTAQRVCVGCNFELRKCLLNLQIYVQTSVEELHAVGIPEFLLEAAGTVSLVGQQWADYKSATITSYKQCSSA
jgi:hypothetical protein